MHFQLNTENLQVLKPKAHPQMPYFVQQKSKPLPYLNLNYI